MSGWRDSNPRPPAPHAGAIPGYATSRGGTNIIHHLLNMKVICKEPPYRKIGVHVLSISACEQTLTAVNPSFVFLFMATN